MLFHGGIKHIQVDLALASFRVEEGIGCREKISRRAFHIQSDVFRQLLEISPQPFLIRKRDYPLDHGTVAQAIQLHLLLRAAEKSLKHEESYQS